MARAARLLVFLALVASAAHAAELGTLFFTPEERSRLDRLRKGEPEREAGGQPSGERRAPEMTGFVKRSDGRNTVWVDGAPITTSKDPRTLETHRQPGAIEIQRKPPG